MRCPDCNKFVSYDEPQCELNSVDVDGDTVRAAVTVQLNCQDCGGTLKDAEIEAEAEIDHDCAATPETERKPDPNYKNDEEQFEIDNEGDPEGTSRVQTTDRHGKPIKSSRYMKSFYGFEMDTDLTCRKCGASVTIHLEGEEQASGFNECC